MRILIDGRIFTKPSTGIATYFKCAIMAMAKNNPELCFYLVTPKPFHFSIKNDFPDNVRVIIESLLIKSIPNTIWFFVKFPFLIQKYHPDLIWIPTPERPFLIPKDIKLMIMVHDVVNIEFVDTMEWINKVYNKLMFKYAIEKSDFIWSNSDYTKYKIEHYFPNRKCKSLFVGASVDTMEFKRLKISDEIEMKILEKYQLKGAFLLFVGSIEPRKNLDFLLNLMPDLNRKYGLKLLIVGAKGWKNSHIYEIINNTIYPSEAVTFAGFIDKEELVILYNIANCYVSTSLNEGFGCPQLEAMFCGCPVICPHNSAMIEVVEGRGITVKSWNEAEWIDIIKNNIRKSKNDYIQYDLSKFNWSNIISELIVYLN